MELAEQKARAVYESLLSSGCASLIADVPESRLCGAEDGDLTVIGADTIVVYRGEILGKPADKSEAYDMLSLLSDRTHHV